jgi:uncharacterized protein (TIGR02001 family)
MPEYLLRRLVCIICLATSTSAVADTRVHIVASNDYVMQGISQTRGKSSLQGGVSYTHNSGFFSGLWIAENTLIPSLYGDYDRTLREVDYYAGYEWLDRRMQPWTFTLVHYSYPGSDKPFSDYRYNELSLSATPVAGLSVTMGISDNLYNRDRYSRFYELTYEKAVSRHTVFNTGLGYNDIDDLYYRNGAYYKNYFYWNIGVSRLIGRVTVDLSYIDTQNTATDKFGTQTAGSRWLFSVAAGF